MLIIAHRLSTVRAADRIITLERGRLVEDGTHDELIHTGGRYATFHRLQAEESMKSASGAHPIKRLKRRPVPAQMTAPRARISAGRARIVETPPSPVGRGIAATIVLLFCAALVWAWWGTIDIVASATGSCAERPHQGDPAI